MNLLFQKIKKFGIVINPFRNDMIDERHGRATFDPILRLPRAAAGQLGRAVWA